MCSKAAPVLGLRDAIEQAGEAAAFLAGDGASGITGEVMYVDNGFNIMGLANEDRE